jgi:hypothetical protein
VTWSHAARLLLGAIVLAGYTYLLIRPRRNRFTRAREQYSAYNEFVGRR